MSDHGPEGFSQPDRPTPGETIAGSDSPPSGMSNAPDGKADEKRGDAHEEREDGVLIGGKPPTAETDALRSSDEPPHDGDLVRGEATNRIGRWGPYKRLKWYRTFGDLGGRDYYREHDPVENEQTRLPAKEGIAVPAVWIAEVYTPSTVSGLLDGIDRLGWTHGRSFDESLAKWMNEVRNGLTAGWRSLGLVSPVSDRHPMRERAAVLPTGVRAAFPKLISLTPGLTVLTMAFIFEDECASAVERPLRADYQTYTERDPLFRYSDVVRHVFFGSDVRLGQRIHGPADQRKSEATAVLGSLEDRCSDWTRRNLPGSFGSGVSGGLYPAAMLMLTERSNPLEHSVRQTRAFNGTGLDQWYDSWSCSEWPNCLMTLPDSWRQERLRLTFACRRSDAFPKEPGYIEPESNWTIAQRGDELISGLISRWALSCLLDGYHQMLSAARDSTASRRSFRPISDVRQLRGLVRAEMFDIMTAAEEVSALAKDKNSFRYGVMEMQHCHPPRGDSIELLSELRSKQRYRAKQVRYEGKLLLSTLRVSADMTQTVSNIRAQRLTLLLSIVSICIAIGAIVVAAHIS